MFLKSEDLRNPGRTTWVDGISYHKTVLIRASKYYLTQTIDWLQMSVFFQKIYRIFQETILLPLHEIFHPAKPLLPSSVRKSENHTLDQFQQYVAHEITPLYQKIILNLNQAKNLSSTETKEKKQIYEQALIFYHQMSPYIQEANRWMTQHKTLDSDITYNQLKSELIRAEQLIKQIASLNPVAPFLKPRIKCKALPMLRPIGLINENKNDCFMNAIRQLLYNIPMLRENLIAKLPVKKYESILVNAARYFLAQKRGETTPLGGSSSARHEVNMQTGCQEDATEALAQLFNEITDLEHLNPLLPPSPDNVKPHNPLLFWTINRKRFQVSDYDKVSAKSQARINTEGWLQAQYTINSTIILDLKNVDNISLETAIQRWAHSKSDGDFYSVENKDGSTAEWPIREEENLFHTLPPYLILTFKRFERAKGESIKETRIVDMHETFILKGNTVHTRENGQYRIKGFVSHFGNSTQNGHYVSYVFIPNSEESEEGKWYLCDDTRVTEVEIYEVRKALTECYFIYSELDKVISQEEAEIQLKMRQLQTAALEQELALQASTKLAESYTPEKQIRTEKTNLKMLKLFEYTLSVEHAESEVLAQIFTELPQDFQSFCLKVLQFEKGYSEKEALRHLNELRSIVVPYLIREQTEALSKRIINQYIYMKEQYLLLLKKSENLKKRSEFQLKQLLALQATLDRDQVSEAHIKLIMPYLYAEVQKEFIPFLGDFKKDILQKKVVELIEATQKFLLD